MIKLVILFLVGVVALKTLKGLFGQGPQAHMETGGRRADEIDDLMVQDPNCDTFIPRRDALRAERDGETVYFCSMACRDAYLMKL